jgi:hypothetical protein
MRWRTSEQRAHFLVKRNRQIKLVGCADCQDKHSLVHQQSGLWAV